MSLMIEISEDEKVTLGNENINKTDSFTYHGSVISKGGGWLEGVKSRRAKAQDIFLGAQK